MFLASTVEKKFISIFATELRRQGVAHPSECEKQVLKQLVIVETATDFYGAIAEGIMTVQERNRANRVDRCAPDSTCAEETGTSVPKGGVKQQSGTHLSDDGVDTKQKLTEDTRWTFELDLSGQRLGNKVTIALCETLLKLNPFIDASVIRWHILLKQNQLTDQCVRHLCFIILFCPSLSLLFVTENSFTKEGIAQLHQACVKTEYAREVHYDDNQIQGQTASTMPKSHFQTQEPSRSNLDAISPYLEKNCEVSQTCQLISASENSSGASMVRETPFQYYRPLFSMEDACRLSRTVAATSPTSRPAACVISNAEALRRRREELFGRSAPVDSDAIHDNNINDINSTINGASDAHKTHSPPQTSSSLSPQGLTDSIQISHVLEESPVVSPLLKRRESSSGRWAALHFSESTSPPPPSPGAPLTAHNKSSPMDSEQDGADVREGRSKRHPYPQGDRPSTRPHEPFEDDEELDLVSNLHPIVGSVLDLSRVVNAESGTLCEPYTHGGAQSVWDVIEAYEEAAQQLNTSGGVDPEVSLRLPAAFIGRNNYSTITVLNLTGNRLKSMQALPATLLQLDISNNDLTDFNGLGSCSMLTVLNARRNRIDRIAGLERNTCLAHIFLGRNRIKAVEGLAHLVILETMDLSYNQIRTFSAVRALSLCSSLRHILLKGNPIVDSTTQGKGCYLMIRNLCPSLLMIDNRKLSHSRFSENLERQESHMRQPMLIDTTHQPRVSFNVENGMRSVTVSRNGDAKAASRDDGLPHTSRIATTTCSGTATSEANREETVPQNAMNLLYLLTHGATPRKGYGDTTRATSALHRISQRGSALREAEEQKKLRQQRDNRSPLRVEMMKYLAEKSKKYFETTIVERVTQIQQQQQQNESGAAHVSPVTFTTQTGRAGDIGVKPVPRPQSCGATQGGSIGKLMGCTAPPPHSNPTDIDVLKPYKPNRFCPPRRPLRVRQAAGSIRRKTGCHQEALLSPEIDGALPDATYANGGPGGARHIAGDRREEASDLSPMEVERFLSYAQLYGAGRALRRADTSPVSMEAEEAPVGCSPIREVSVADDSLNARPPEISRGAERAVVGRNLLMKLNDGQPPLSRRGQLSAFVKDRESHRVSIPVSARRPSPSQRRRMSSAPTSKCRSHRSVAAPDDCQPLDERREGLGKLPTTSQCLDRPVAAQDTFGKNIQAPISTPSLHTETPLHTRILAWKNEITEDVKTVQAALNAILSLLQAQRSNTAGLTSKQQPVLAPYLEERRKCVEIIQKSGMLSDTQIPKEVVVHYGFEKAELEGMIMTRQSAKWESKASRERMSVLQQVKILGDAKTCLRYLVILMGSGDEFLLQDYINQIRETFTTC